MAEYYVRCDSCNAEHNARAWDIDQLVKRCEYCGDDVCPDCKSKLDELFHEDCLQKDKDEQ